MNAEPFVTIGLPGRSDRGVVTTPEVADLLARGAPVAMGVSGGKDSCALAIATMEHLDSIGHTGPRKLIHSDLGRVEWKESLPVCERLAERLGLELIVVRRAAGDMMDRWLVRWENNLTRYRALSCVRVILPWSTPSMRFCTSELKTAVMCRELVKRFPGQTILSASGIRRAESAKRKLAPIAKVQKKLTSATHATRGIDWNPVIEWSHADVYRFLADRAFALHEAYTKYNMSRVSCAYCIMSSEDDLAASTTCPDNHDVYREMASLEIVSTFAFQGDRWLGDVAPHLLTHEMREGLALAKERAKRREAVEARIPKHLLYTKGWPTVMPTWDEAVMLAEVRIAIAEIVGISDVTCTDPQTVTARYAALMAQNAARNKNNIDIDDED